MGWVKMGGERMSGDGRREGEGGSAEVVKGSRRTGDADGRSAEGVEVLVTGVLADNYVGACETGSRKNQAYVL